MKDLEKRKAIVPVGTSGHILKDCWQEMAEPIYNIIEYSLNNGRKADMINIYKNINKEEPLNYISVSLTSIVCKMSEEVTNKTVHWLLRKKSNNR